MSTVAYVSNAQSGSISVLALNSADGHLQVLQELVVGGQVMPLALAPGGRFLYAARRSAPLAVLCFEINRADGRLGAPLETALPASMPSLTLDATGRWLLAASYHEGIVAVCGVGASGQVLPAHQVLASGPKTHRIVTTHDNQHALACVLGSDELVRYRFNAGRGVLTEHEVLHLRPGSGPRHLVLHPQGKRAWVLGELDGSITTVALTPGEMRVVDVASALPPGFAGTPWAADLHLHLHPRLHPNLHPRGGGGLLVASERRGSTLTLLAINAATGTLRPLGHWPTQAQPRGFAISPCGRWLLCAGERSHRVGLHRINAAGGTLSFVAELAVGQGPNWIEMLELP